MKILEPGDEGRMRERCRAGYAAAGDAPVSWNVAGSTPVKAVASMQWRRVEAEPVVPLVLDERQAVGREVGLEVPGRNLRALHALEWATMDVHAFSNPAAARFRRHTHETMHLCAVLDGGFVERDGKASVELAAGDVRLSPACRHDIDFGPAGARCLLIELKPAAVEPLHRSLFVAGLPRLGGLVQHLAEAQAGAVVDDDTLRALRVEAAATELLAQLERLRDGRRLPPPPWLEWVREVLHDAADMPSVAELAGIAGVHRVHLARAFRDHFGVSVSAYTRRLRLERAVRLLRDGDLPLAAVAADAGFADQSHLTRTLRRAFGVTPARLRRG